MQDIKIFRTGVNDYEEKEEDLFVVKIEGYYNLGKNLIVVSYAESASTNKNYSEMLSVMVNDISAKVKQDDYFNISNIKYRIINIQSVLNIYLDFTLERV